MFYVVAAYAASSALLPMLFFVVLGAFDACAYAAYNVYITFAACLQSPPCESTTQIKSMITGTLTS